MTYRLGIDLGGTNIAVAVIDETMKILARANRRTMLDPSPAGIASSMAELCAECASALGISLAEIASVGIGSPGIADPATGVVERWAKLDFRDVPLSQLLSDRIKKPVFLENDANAAALGEFAAGCGKGSSDFIAVTLGTGIGGGVIIGGKLLRGMNNSAAELGHMVIDKNGPLCPCGRHGCFEALASGSALISFTRAAMQKHPESAMWALCEGSLDNANGRTPFDAARQGDPFAAEVIDEYTGNLACGLVNIINIFQPEVLCVGGGISGAGEVLLRPVRALADCEEYSKVCKKRTRIVQAQLGNDAGLIGAAILPLYC